VNLRHSNYVGQAQTHQPQAHHESRNSRRRIEGGILTAKRVTIDGKREDFIICLGQINGLEIDLHDQQRMCRLNRCQASSSLAVEKSP
jgi:hypothetical protein